VVSFEEEKLCLWKKCTIVVIKVRCSVCWCFHVTVATATFDPLCRILHSNLLDELALQNEFYNFLIDNVLGEKITLGSVILQTAKFNIRCLMLMVHKINVIFERTGKNRSFAKNGETTKRGQFMKIPSVKITAER